MMTAALKVRLSRAYSGLAIICLIIFKVPLTARLVIDRNKNVATDGTTCNSTKSFFLSLPSSPCQISVNKVVVVFKFFFWRKGTFNILSQSRKVCNRRDSWGVRSIEGTQGR